MSKIKVSQEIKVYEIDGNETVGETVLKVFSHWNWKDRAVLQLGKGRKFTILRQDLITALDNAGNTGD